MMHTSDVLPEIKEIIGALLFAAKQPVSASRLRDVLRATAEQVEGPARELAGASTADIEGALQQLRDDIERQGLGIRIVSVAGGYRMENDTRCGPWLRQFLEKGKPTRLSQPALETLAIIAYRQPVVRSEIEAVRGVAVDQIVRNLLDLQLIRAVGRSDLPGRPWLFGTTQRFLEYFGLSRLEDLPGTDELRRMEAERKRDAGLPSGKTNGNSAESEPAEDESGADNAVAPEPAVAEEEASADASALGKPDSMAPSSGG